ncbi:hypothetical protein LTR17_012082 [Elasticomyces elasticus]|nr:hypothetical protein LTR17_012082 [Elasticomyces elasticus]
MFTAFGSCMLVFYALLSVSSAQCSNEVAAQNQGLRTASANNTWMIVPVPNADCQKALDATYGLTIPNLFGIPGLTIGRSLVVLADLPTSDETLFPKRFPNGFHPVLVDTSYQSDIRMSAFKIPDDALLGGGLYIPYVHRATIIGGNANTILQAPISAYLTGPKGNFVAGLVPALVSTFIEGYFLRLASVIPNDAAFRRNDNNILSNSVSWLVGPNPASGPGVIPTACDLQYIEQDKFNLYTAKLFKAMINQPSILQGPVLFPGNMCQRNQYYYKNDTSTMIPVTGNVTFGPAADGITIINPSIIQNASPDRDGIYRGNEGFRGCGQNVGFNPENCDVAVQKVDQAALD